MIADKAMILTIKPSLVSQFLKESHTLLHSTIMDTIPKNDIFYAIQKEDFPEVKLFVEKRNVSVYRMNDYRETPAHVAASRGNLPILEYLVGVDARALNVTDGWGQSVLHAAAERGSLEMVKFLVEEHKMDVHKRNEIFSGNAPIHVAALRGSMELLKYFIEDRKVDPNLRNKLGQPPVLLAAQKGHLPAVKYLYENQNGAVHVIDKENKTILHMCALTADLKVPKYLLDEKKLVFDVNLQDSLGNTVVLWASRRNRMDFIKYFVEEKHADINIQNYEGWTALHNAVNFRNKELIEYLYKHGANAELKQKEGYVARNLTDDSEVHQLIDNLTRVKRYRRNVFQPCPILYGRKQGYGYDLPRLKEHGDRVEIARPVTENVPQLNSFLLLTDVCLRYFTKN